MSAAQDLARHSDPRLTIGRHSHTRLHDLTGVLESLPGTAPEEARSEARVATGTDGTFLMPANRRRRGGDERPIVANRGDGHDDCSVARGGEGDRPQTVVLSLLDDTRATSGQTWPKAEGTGLEPATPYGAPHFQ